jgi:23S rRNA pseudouridine1911/1915/1917 synthase
VLGDALYGVPFPQIKRQALHALTLGFEQPRTKKWIQLTSELPEDMQGLLRFLESQV